MAAAGRVAEAASTGTGAGGRFDEEVGGIKIERDKARRLLALALAVVEDDAKDEESAAGFERRRSIKGGCGRVRLWIGTDCRLATVDSACWSGCCCCCCVGQDERARLGDLAAAVDCGGGGGGAEPFDEVVLGLGILDCGCPVCACPGSGLVVAVVIGQAAAADPRCGGVDASI